MVINLLRRMERDVGKPLVVWYGYGSVEKNGESVGKPLVVWFGYGSVEKNGKRCRKTTGCM